MQDAQTFMQNRGKIANSYLNFYSSNIDFPKKLKDGWYDAITIKKNGVNNASRKDGFKEENDFILCVCKVVDNKVVEYYENINIADIKSSFVFQKVKIDVSSEINNCRITFRAYNDSEYSAIYFLDNILDPTKQITDPGFAFFTVYTSNNFNAHDLIMNIQIARNKPITLDEVLNFSGGPYILTVGKPNPLLGDCANSQLTFAFRKSADKFSIGVIRFDDKATWVINDIELKQNICNSTILSEK